MGRGVHPAPPLGRVGAPRRLFEGLTADIQIEIVRRVLIDLTIVRAHQHAAGAEKKIGVERLHRAQGLGRSRGELTTRMVVTAADKDMRLAEDVAPGRTHVAARLVSMLNRTPARVAVTDELVGDKVFEGGHLRCACVERNVNPNIRPKANRDPDAWVW